LTSYFWRLELVSWADKAEEYAAKNNGTESKLIVVRDTECVEEKNLTINVFGNSRPVKCKSTCSQFVKEWDHQELKYSNNSHPHVNVCCSSERLDGHVDGQLKLWKNTGLRTPSNKLAYNITKNLKWCHKAPTSKAPKSKHTPSLSKRKGQQQDVQLTRGGRSSYLCAELLARCMKRRATCKAVPTSCLRTDRLDEEVAARKKPLPRCFKAQGCRFLNRCRHAVSLNFRCLQGGVRHAVVENMAAFTQDTRLAQHCAECTDLSLKSRAQA